MNYNDYEFNFIQDDEELVNFQYNASFIIGYYKGTLKIVLDEIKNEDEAAYIRKYMVPSIEKALEICEDVWEHRYEKHYSNKHK